MPVTLTPAQTDELYKLVKFWQPDCLINSRIGNGYGDYVSCDDNEIPSDDKTGMLYESPCTINDTWGYKSYDNNWKTPEEIARLRKHLNTRGINYLLNVGPDALGRIPGPSRDVLLGAAKLF